MADSDNDDHVWDEISDLDPSEFPIRANSLIDQFNDVADHPGQEEVDNDSSFGGEEDDIIVQNTVVEPAVYNDDNNENIDDNNDANDNNQNYENINLNSNNNDNYISKPTTSELDDPTAHVEFEIFQYIQNFGFSRKAAVKMFSRLKSVLQETSAVIAGGCIVSALTKRFDIRDIDIYVQAQDVQKVLDVLFSVWYLDHMSENIAPPYDHSFLRKQKILAKYHLIGAADDDKVPHVDVMVIHPDVSVETVVGNFDMTFCSVLYNGHEVKAINSSLESLIQLQGELRPEYLKGYLSSNMYIINRVNKYRVRGFTIKSDNSYPLRVTGHKECVLDLRDKSGFDWVLHNILTKLIHYEVSEKEDMKLPIYLAKIDIDNNTQQEKIDVLTAYLQDQDIRPMNIVMDILAQEYTMNQYTQFELDQMRAVVCKDQLVFYKNFLSKYIHSLNHNIASIPDDNYQLVYNEKDGQGFDISMGSQLSITDWLDEDKGNCVFVCDKELICMSKDNLLNYYYLEKDDNWFYECTTNRMGSVKKDNPYIGLPLSASGAKWYISPDSLFIIIHSPDQIFELQKDTHIGIDGKTVFAEFKYTATHKNVHGNQPHYVSANHCQDLTQINLDKVYIVQSKK
jgi:hypothetical protein